MTYNPQVHNRKSVRKKNHDYQNGSYFITICAVNREWLFGEIKNDAMELNEFGKIVEKCWQEIPAHFSNASLKAFVIMPNHIHGILNLQTPDINVVPIQDLGGRGIACNAPTRRFQSIEPGSLGTAIRSFKSATTRHINRLRNSPATPVWQRNYHEHAIRNDVELQKIRTYIRENPKHWLEDEEYSPSKK